MTAATESRGAQGNNVQCRRAAAKGFQGESRADRGGEAQGPGKDNKGR